MKFTMLQRPSNQLEQTIYHTFMIFSWLLVFISLVISFWYDIAHERNAQDRVITGAAAYIANSPQVIAMLESGYPDSTVVSEINSFCREMPDISTAVIYSTNGLRFYHTARASSGESYLDGDEKAILAGADPYITTGYDTTGAQRRAYHAIRNSGGSIIGFVMLSIPQAVISANNNDLFLLYLGIFFLMVVMSLFATQLILRYIRSSLAGHDPDELLNLYSRQDSVINNLAEGVAATDRSGKIIFANSEARQLLAKGLAIREHRIEDIYPDSSFRDVISGEKPAFRRTARIGGRNLIITEAPIMPKSDRQNLLHPNQPQKPEGELLILQDRTEMLRLSDELSGAQSMMDTMRAFNHEYLNKLHVILGYLQIGEIDEAKKFITNVGLVHSQQIRETANCIRANRICALVIGKMMHAAELGIKLQLTPDSLVLETDLLIPQNDCVTIIGNLLENAIDELSSAFVPVKEITLSLYFSQEANIIMCTDTGRGIDPGVLPRIFVKGVTTKGDGHGTGLYLVHEITENNGGSIDIDSEPGEGTCFTITFPGARPGKTDSERSEGTNHV